MRIGTTVAQHIKAPSPRRRKGRAVHPNSHQQRTGMGRSMLTAHDELRANPTNRKKAQLSAAMLNHSPKPHAYQRRWGQSP